MDPYRTLDWIEAELRIVLDSLDTSTTACEGCKTKRYNNWAHHQAAEALRGALSRVEKARKILDNGATSTQGEHR